MTGVVYATIVLVLSVTSTTGSPVSASNETRSMKAYSPTQTNFVIKGCFRQGDRNKEMPLLVHYNNMDMTLEMCAKTCDSLGYAYAGVQHGANCACGRTYGSHGESNNCTMKCTGNHEQICGGALANTVLEIVQPGHGIGYENVGCYGDDNPRGLPHYTLYNYKRMTHMKCAESCGSIGYKYAGIMKGYSCRCGNSFVDYNESNSCDMPCEGYQNDMCGGKTAITVLQIRQDSYFDVETDWILVQQNLNGSTIFSDHWWNDYKNGFGFQDGNFWIGNDLLHQLSSWDQHKLRVDLQAKYDGRWYWAEYSRFKVADESDNYRLTVGGYSGTAGDSLSFHDGAEFSTEDRDDEWGCASGEAGNSGGFWYANCSKANVNGSPLVNTWVSEQDHEGFVWYALPLGDGAQHHKLMTSRMWLVPL